MRTYHPRVRTDFQSQSPGYTFRKWCELLSAQLTTDLGPITARVHGGCMGLPQEVIERIMTMLQDDVGALKACSLTCKSMFASTRHLIHKTLYITSQNNLKLFTPTEKKRYGRDYQELELRFLPFMGERDLLKYARHLYICIGPLFSPRALEPHLQHLRSLDKIHTLTIRLYTAPLWCGVSNTVLTQFYPTLTTLVLHFPIGHHRHVLQFALQFLNLENLTLKYLSDKSRVATEDPVPPIVTRLPSLRGHLRCAGLRPQESPVWPMDLAFDLPSGTNFRSIEFQNVRWERGQQILDGCAGSLEEFTVRIRTCGDGESESLPRLFRVTKTKPVRIVRGLRTRPIEIPGK